MHQSFNHGVFTDIYCKCTVFRPSEEMNGLRAIGTLIMPLNTQEALIMVNQTFKQFEFDTNYDNIFYSDSMLAIFPKTLLIKNNLCYIFPDH